MNTSPSYAASWKLCAITCLAMVLLSLTPQIHLWIARGRDWNGAYVIPQGDEPLYSAYVNALIDGRTRKNDPFGGRDTSVRAPLPESFFSIQMVPAYIIALPARLLGVSASTAFIVLIAAAAFLTGLSVFWLLKSVAADYRLAAAGTLFVLCLGALAGGNGLLGILLKPDLSIPSLPFLRRYEPAAVFPLFFVFQLLVWRALTSQSKRVAQISATLAGLTLATLVFSYVYLWTALAAWLACIGALWLYFRPYEGRKTLALLTTVGSITTLALVPYLYMVSHQAAILDTQQQILISTHSPDLFRVDEILGAIILVALGIGVSRGRIERTDTRLILASSLALLPLVVFNQQVLTGKTMQAYHFEAFVVNYSTLVAFVLTVTVLWTVSDRLLICVAALSFSWGIVEVGLPSRLIFVPAAIAKDQSIPPLRRLKELSRQDGTLADLRTRGQASTQVFSPDVSLIALLPTWTSQGTLLDIAGVYCGNVTREDRKVFFYMHLYYSKAESQELRKSLNEGDQFAIDVLFGHERLFPALSSQFRPIQSDEIERAAEAYQTYVNSFSRDEALKRPITYAVIPLKGKFDFTNLDRWYKRDAGERVGDFMLYRLKLRD